MKTFKIFSTAALALMMAACSSEDAALNNSPAQQQGRKVHFTATIAAPGGNAGTRTEYTEVTEGDAAGTINVAWKANDEIALIHNGTKDVVTVETVNEDGSATITGDITVGTNGEAVEVCYPAALWEWNDKAQGAIRNATFVTNITTKQDGTLKYIQDNLDTRMAKGQLKVDGDKATLAANVTLASQIAIWKLTMQDDATPTPKALAATQVSVIKGSEPEPIASTAELSTATSTVYLAIDKFSDQKVTIQATVGSDTYKYEKEGVSLALGQYYQSTVTMANGNNNNYLMWDGTQKKLVAKPMPESATAVENVNDNVEWAAGTYVVEGNVTINGTILLSGDVNLIIKDGAKLTVNSYINGPNQNLSIYGQANQTGQLVVNSTDDAISGINTLEVHSCKVKATSSANFCGGFFDIGTFNVYGGSVDAEYTGSSKGYGIRLKDGGSMNIYGGEVKAEVKGDNIRNSHGIMGSATITVYGGKLWAGSANESALYNITLKTGDDFTGSIQTSDENDTYEAYPLSDTPTSHYVKVE